MNQKICRQCRSSNTPEMSFCSNCGQKLAASEPDFSSDLPPTIFAGSPNNPGFAPKASDFAPQIPILPPPAASRKSRTGMWLAILGGLGALIFLGGAVALGGLFYLINSNKDESGSNYNSSFSNASSENKTVRTVANSSSSGGSTGNTTAAGSTSQLLNSLQTRKQIGGFTQISSKYVTPGDYFPKATDAAQALYQNGEQAVALTIGKFPSGASAKAALKIQLNGVKSEKGTISFSNLDKLAFDSATYNYKGYSFYEECSDKGLCTRMHSKDDTALAEFMNSYAK